jgi:hypothetical protein
VFGLWSGLLIGASGQARADTVIGVCTIAANPTSTTVTNCPSAALSGANLSDLDLSYANLSWATDPTSPRGSGFRNLPDRVAASRNPERPSPQ